MKRELSKKEVNIIYQVFILVNFLFFALLVFGEKNEKYNEKVRELEEYKSKYNEEVEIKEGIEEEYLSLMMDYLRLSDKCARKEEEIEKLEEVCEYNNLQVKEYNLSLDDLYLIAEICEYEAGSQCKEGQKAVFTVIMNRLGSSKFPNSVEEIIYQEGQFTTAKLVKGRVNREVLLNVLETLIEGYDLPKDVLFFRSGKECVNEKDYKVIEGNVFSF